MRLRCLGLRIVLVVFVRVSAFEGFQEGDLCDQQAGAVAVLQRNIDVFLINLDGSGLEQVTFNDTFDGFPMFSPDGRHIVFASNRNAKAEGETNVFIADWVN